jgi:hypothetical protein
MYTGGLNQLCIITQAAGISRKVRCLWLVSVICLGEIRSHFRQAHIEINAHH